jgi:hypothetical protein
LFNVSSTFYYLKFVTRPIFDEDPMSCYTAKDSDSACPKMEAKTLGSTLKIGLVGLVETHVYFFFRNKTHIQELDNL